MHFITKWCIYSENSGNHIVSLCDDGTYQCDCIGWTRHMPRRNCKHIYRVIDEKPEPLDKENWDKLQGKKKKIKAFIDKIDKVQQSNPEPEIVTATIYIDGKPFPVYNGSSFVKKIFGGQP